MEKSNEIKIENDLSLLPEMRVNTLSKKGMFVYNIPSSSTASSSLNEIEVENKEMTLLENKTKLNLSLIPVYSSDGKMSAILKGGIVEIYNTENDELIQEVSSNNVNSNIEKVEFSPLGNYLITWSRNIKNNKDESPSDNLLIWKIRNNSETIDNDERLIVLSFFIKSYKKDIVQWTSDEKYLFFLNSNTIYVYLNMNHFENKIVINQLQQKNITSYKISNYIYSSSTSSNPGINLGTYSKESNGNPAIVVLHRYDSLTSTSLPLSLPPPRIINSRRILTSSTECNLLFNFNAHSLLAFSSGEVDLSNASYYGSTTLILLTDGDSSSNNSNNLNSKSNSSGSEVICEVISLSKEGPVYDVSWSPDGSKFAVCAGNMPSHCTFYNFKGEPIYECGPAHRNTVSWSPHGRFICIAGFGNLAGEMDFYDTVKLKKIGSNVSHCAVSHGWSPDSRRFLTSVLAPRMNVDNGFKVFKYNGVGPIHSHQQEPSDNLYFASFHPFPSQLYPNRGQSPKRVQNDANNNSQNEIARPVVQEAPKAKTPYRPPGSTGALSALLRKESNVQSSTLVVGKIKKPSTNTPSTNNDENISKVVKEVRRIPGMAPPAPVNENKNKKQDKTLKNNNSTNSNNNNVKAASPIVPPSKNAVNAPANASANATGEQSNAGKLKAVRKKLKQAASLKERRLAGEELNQDQLSKLESEQALLEEEARLILLL